MAWNKKHLAVYGLSTEGYQIAMKFSERGYETTIVDERLNSPIKLERRSFSRNKTVDEFFEEDNLAEITSLQDSISCANFIIYCPKIRCDTSEIYYQYDRSLKEIVPLLSKNTILVFWIPLGLDGQSQIISMVQKYTNLKDNQYGLVFLPPFFDEKLNVVGSFGNTSNSLEILSEVIGRKILTSTVEEAERVFCNKILDKFSNFTSKFITLSGLNYASEELFYYNDLFYYYTDLKMIYNTSKRSSQIKSFSSSLMRIVESYPKSLLNYIKDTTKEMNVKPSRAKITILWSKSNYHVRPDLERAASDFLSLIQDVFVDVKIFSFRELVEQKILSTTLSRDPNFLITCSETDFNNIKDKAKEKEQTIIVIKATLPPSRLT
ncbi:MAG: hypothetical protein QXJ17_03000 [Nitrososphaeria archaeon]